MNRVTLGVLGTFVLILIGTGILAYVFRDPSPTTVTAPPSLPRARRSRISH